jgi:hypothetical protein
MSRSFAGASLVCVVLSLGCGAASAQDRVLALPPPWQASVGYGGSYAPAPSPAPQAMQSTWDPDATLAAATASASPGPRRVLTAARAMLDESTVVQGSCYDWVDAVYARAGGAPHHVFDGGRVHGPFAESTWLVPGDWVFFINHGNGDDTHSAIFLGWIDESARLAWMVSYAGGHRDEPARFGTYELTNVYRLVRMDDAPSPPVVHRTRQHAHHERHAAVRRATRRRG